MSNNLGYTIGAGANIAADDVSSVFYQRIKLADGTEDSSTPINSGNGVATNALRVTLASDSTGIVALTTSTASIGKLAANSGVDIGDVDVTSVPADPFGVNADAASATGSISAKLRFIAATGIPVTGTVTVSGTVAIGAGSAVIGHVIVDSGTVAATQSGTWNITNVSGTVSLPTGAATAAKQPALGTAGTASTDVITVQGIASMTKLLVTPDSVALPANQSVNVSQINGVTVLMGNGASGTGAQRVTIANDSTGVLATVSTVTTVTTLTGSGVASGATDSGNPHKIGGKYNSSPITLTDGQRGDIQLDSAGYLKVNVASGGSSGTQYTNDAALPTSGTAGVGTLAMGRAKAAAPADVSADNDAVSAWHLLNGAQCVTLTAAGALIGGDATNGLDVDVTRMSALVAGSALIGSVSIDQTTPGTTNKVVASVASGGIASGAVASGAVASGAFASGALASGSIAAGAIAAGATSIADNEDAASADGDRGVKVLFKRLDTPANSSGTDADYEQPQMSGGRVWVDASGKTLTVSGTVTANAGTNLNTSLLALESGGNLATLAGAVTSSVVQANVKQINGVTVLMGNGASGTGAQRVTIANDSTGVLATVTTVTTLTGGGVASGATDSGNPVKVGGKYNSTPITLTDGQRGDAQLDASGFLKVNIAAGGGSGGTNMVDDAAFTVATTAFTPAGGTYRSVRDAVDDNDGGAFAMNAKRAMYVSLETPLSDSAMDDTLDTVKVSQATAANLNAAVVGTGTAGSAAGGVLTIQGVASMTKLLVTPDANSAVNMAQVGGTNTVTAGVAGTQAVGGNVATNVAIGTNPVNLGAQAVSSENTAVTATRMAQLVTDLVGKLIVLPYANPENFVSGAITSAMTGTTSTSLIAAPASGLRNYITQITVSNAHATVGTDVVIQDGSGGTTLYTIPAAAAYGGATLTFPTPLRQPTTATAIYVANVTTGASVKASASGYKGI